MSIETIQARGHTTPDGILNLSVNVGVANADVAVILQVQALADSNALDANGWPQDFFAQVAGSMPHLERPPQGEFEERLPLS